MTERRPFGEGVGPFGPLAVFLGCEKPLGFRGLLTGMCRMSVTTDTNRCRNGCRDGS